MASSGVAPPPPRRPRATPGPAPLPPWPHLPRRDGGGARSPTSVVAPISALVGLLLVVGSAAVLVLHCRRKPRSSSRDGDRSFRDKQAASNAMSYTNGVGGCIYGGSMGFPVQPRSGGAQVFTYKELELATDGFSERNVVGGRELGVVFRGRLGDGTAAAIKRLHCDGRQGEREFRVEVDLLSRMHSPYLVQLLGYCTDQNHRLLVFEFMLNGTLKNHLHGTFSEGSRQPLDWLTRLTIALDCARALEFLHEHNSPAVIHRDFNCSNILLDCNFRAKVSDFGTAKIGSDKVNGQVHTRVFGTTGYLAPEYASTGKLTTKSDVYSYGVVLLELLTGRVPVDTRRPPGEHVLVSWALPRLTNRDKVMQMVDPTLRGQFAMKDLIQVAAIAAMCVQPEADYRPLMTDVVQSLIPILKSPSISSPSTPARSSTTSLFQ